jgi:murein DD-endopeptidase MepM/ murein hydrolase activator NlpD
MMVLPRVSSSAGAPAVQVPTAIPSNILGKPTPKPSPSETEDPGGGGNNNNGGGGNNNNGGGGDDDGKNNGKGDDKKDDKDGKKDKNDKNGKPGKDGKKGKKGKRHGKKNVPESNLNIPGSWTTDKLVAVATRLRSLGWSEAQVEHEVFAPFILAGPAAWIDTWHAPRYGPAPGQIRQHEGQDVFCNYGDPVLATEDGTIQFDSGGLGGNIARLFRPDGTYWYYAHLSEFNTELTNGDAVRVGDLLGYCGISGNAVGTPPHVHFGWYHAGGSGAMNPLRHLINWLHAAEDHALTLVGKTTRKNIRKQPERTLERLFGDGFAPDRSELRVSGESLYAAGSAPSTGAFALAQTALQAALSENSLSPTPSTAPEIDEGTSLLDPDSALARLLNSSAASSTGETGE